MNFQNIFCWICLKKDNILKLSDKDNNGISHITKLTSSLVGMDFKELNNMKFICEECCTTLNTVYNFQQKCLRSKINFITYISQNNDNYDYNYKSVKNEENVLYTNNVFENDKSKHIKKEKMENLNEIEDDRVGKFEENFIRVKNEHIDFEDETENQNSIQDNDFKDYKEVNFEQVNYKNEIDIEEDPLVMVKNEHKSNNVTPQDGSTNQLDGTQTNSVNENTCSDNSSQGSYPAKHVQAQDKGSYECEICGKIITNQKYMVVHMRRHREKLYPCEVCKKKFSRKEYLTVHMRIHSGEQPYKCKICEEAFTYSGLLTVHMRNHTGESPFECKICKKTFKRKGYLGAHMRIHSGEKPYECGICKKTFTYTGTLTVHMRKHTGERPYECKICNKGFVHTGALSIHMRKHTGEKPYECKICKLKCNLKGNLTAHMRIHSGEKQNEHKTN